jgi:hypothetical protein
VRTDSYVIAVKVAQRTNDPSGRDVLSAAEIGQQLIEGLHSCGIASPGFLVEAEIVVGDTRDEHRGPANLEEIESRVLEFSPSRTPSLDRLVARGHY